MAVYFIQQGVSGPIKIGKADDPSKRIDDLDNTSTPYELRRLLIVWPWSYAEERTLHSEFADLRTRSNREWFEPEPGLLGFIETLGALIGRCGFATPSWATVDGLKAALERERADKAREEAERKAWEVRARNEIREELQVEMWERAKVLACKAITEEIRQEAYAQAYNLAKWEAEKAVKHETEHLIRKAFAAGRAEAGREHATEIERLEAVHQDVLDKTAQLVREQTTAEFDARRKQAQRSRQAMFRQAGLAAED